MPFRDLAGHGHLIELLARAAVRGTLPPSLIFAGPDGVGKRTAAIALAQLLNCPERLEVPAPGGGVMTDACGTCPTCRRIGRGVHADVMGIRPGDTGSIKIDEARRAIDAAGYRPFEGRRRVIIFDEADALGEPAQDALLKTLEEPSPTAVFILVTSRPDALLPTVLSRCQRVRFGRLGPADIARVLVAKEGYRDTDARAAASAADGSLGRALEGASDEFAEARESALALLRGVAGSADPVGRLGLARDLVATGASRGAAEREALARRLRALASLLRDLEALSVRADGRWLANGDLTAGLQALGRSFGGDRARRAFAAVDRALAALDRNASPKIVADWLAVTI
jgi:DNA polymerase III subunit delta'